MKFFNKDIQSQLVFNIFVYTKFLFKKNYELFSKKL